MALALASHVGAFAPLTSRAVRVSKTPMKMGFDMEASIQETKVSVWLALRRVLRCVGGVRVGVVGGEWSNEGATKVALCCRVGYGRAQAEA